MGILQSDGTRDPKAIEYLAFEGGGGKGFAFLGTLQFLEQPDVDVLPLHREGRANQIAGISGASAGAITALLIALGFDGKKVGEQIADRSILESFMDEAQPGVMRHVGDEYVDGRDHLLTSQNDPYARLLPRPRIDLEAIGRVVGGVALVGKLPVVPSVNGMLFRILLEIGRGNPDYAMLCNALLRSPNDYQKSLLQEFGFFPGVKVRAYFHRLLRENLPAIIDRTHGAGASKRVLGKMKPEHVTFAKFNEGTGIDLVFTGTNLSTRRPVIFSGVETPDFPVAEAVAISMNLPLIYKPVAVTARVNGETHHQGMYVDGGLLNNLPIHAFDDRAPQGPGAGTQDPESTLHPGILALRLSSGYDVVPPEPFYPVLDVYRGWNMDRLSIAVEQFGGFLGALGEINAFPAEEGLLRAPAERRQTIELFAGNLTTFNFLPAQSDIDAAVRAAYQRTREYFGA